MANTTAPAPPRGQATLSRQGRYNDVAGNLKAKEVRIAEDERFVICCNPESAERDAAIRALLIAQLKELTGGSDKLSKDKPAELRGVISTKPGLNQYLRTTPVGLQHIDASRAKAEENLDGKYLLRTSGSKMTSEDITLDISSCSRSRGWRDMKAGHRPAPGLPPQGRAHPRPRHPVLARPSCPPASPRMLAATPGRTCAATSPGRAGH